MGKKSFLRAHWRALVVSGAAGLGLLAAFVAAGRLSGPEDVFGAAHETLVACGAVGLACFGFEELRKKRLIENIPSSTCRSVAMGLAEVSGAVRPKQLLKSPLTRSDCVYYRFLIEVEKRTRRGSRWEVLNQGESTNYFYVDDGTGKLMVDPLDAEVVLPPDYSYIDTVGMDFTRKRYTEWRIEPDETVFVIGCVRKFTNAVEDRKVRLADRLSRLKADKQRLMAYDTDKDGHISPEEWDRAVIAEKEAMLAQEIRQPPPPEDDIVLAKGDFEQTLLITDSSEKDLLGRLVLRGAAGIAGGGALILGMTASYAARIGLMSEALRIPWQSFYR